MDSLFVSADDRAVSDRGGRSAPPQKVRGARRRARLPHPALHGLAGGVGFRPAAAPVESVVSLYVFTVVIGLFEVVAVILLIASVETSLRKRYAPKAAA